MPDINLEGNAVESIFLQAINSMPQGAGFIAKMIASQKRRRPLGNQQLFQKTMKAMKNMDVGKEEDILKYATRAYLQQNFSLPACDASAYDISVGRGKITLKYNPSNPKAIPLAFWANKQGTENKTISEAQQARTFTKLTPDEVNLRLNENSKWLEQKEVYKHRIAEMFGASTNQLADIFKDDLPGRADFSGCEISGFDFTGYDLTGANLKGAKITNCIFSSIEKADLSSAVIDSCVFTGAKLAASDFHMAAIKNTTFDNADLRGCNFGQSEPDGVTFRDAIFKDTNLDFIQPKNIVFDSEKSAPAASKKPGRPRGSTKSASQSQKISQAKDPLTAEKKKSMNHSPQANNMTGAIEAAATQAVKPSRPPVERTISM